MAIELIDKIKQKNNGTFALVDATDVEFEDGTRLQELLNSGQLKGEKGDTAMVNLSIVDNKLVITNVELSQNNADDRRY